MHCRNRGPGVPSEKFRYPSRSRIDSLGAVAFSEGTDIRRAQNNKICAMRAAQSSTPVKLLREKWSGKPGFERTEPN
ncbi:MAG TPA: hypothetical protein DCG12_06665 [Planctomycetaceae bacterium]|nr:hypothetical protein [Planctomycetaceae bacterium]